MTTPQKEHVEYVGRNGQTYLTPEDAEFYGTGLIGRKVTRSPVIEHVNFSAAASDPDAKAKYDATLAYRADQAIAEGGTAADVIAAAQHQAKGDVVAPKPTRNSKRNAEMFEKPKDALDAAMA